MTKFSSKASNYVRIKYMIKMFDIKQVRKENLNIINGEKILLKYGIYDIGKQTTHVAS